MKMQIKHVSEINASDLEPIRHLVEQFHKADSGGLERRAKAHLVSAVIDLFTIQKKESID